MATKLYMRDDQSDWTSGNNDANLRGTAQAWDNRLLSTTAGSSLANPTGPTTVTGPTNGLEVRTFISAPLDADVTISGSITWNLWASENNMSANVAINGRLEVIDGATGTITLIDQTANVTEVAVTTNAVNNFAETPAAGVACKRGDRLRVRIFGDDAGTMASGFTFSFGYSGPTAGSNGDSWLSLTEDLTFVSEPAGSTVYPTDTASAVSTASVDREAWTSRGAGVQSDVTNTAAGWTSPIQVTDTAGGTVVDWFTKQLTAFTLGGAVRCNVRGLESAGAANATFCVQIAVVASDGTSPTVWAKGAYGISELSVSEAAQSFLVAGDDLSVSNGQRIRIRLFIEDSSTAAMGASQTVTSYYAGTSGGASGDTYFTFTQTLTEYSPGTTVTPTTAALTLTTFAPTVSATANQTVTPSTATLATSAFAPVMNLTIVGASPTALVTTTFAPTVTATANQLVTATTVALTLTTYAPTVNGITVTEKLGAGNFADTSNISSYATGSITWTANRLALLFIYNSDGSNAIQPASVTGNSLTWTLHTTKQHSTDATRRISVYYAWTGSSPTAGAITVDFSGDSQTGLQVHALEVGGTNASSTNNGLGGIVQVVSGDWTSTANPSITLATFADATNNMAMGAFGTGNADPSVGSGFTQAQETTMLTPTVFVISEYKTGQDLSVDVTAGTHTGVGLALELQALATAPQTVTPSTASLTTTAFAPTVTATNHQLVTPTTVSLATATFAPTVTASNHQLVTPSTASLATATFAPTVSATANQVVTPTTATLATATFAPTVTASDHKTVTPTTASLALSTFAPTVSVANNITVTPTTASLVTATFAPTISTTDHKLVTPSTAALSLATFAPTVTASDHKTVTPSTASLSLATFAPTVSATAHQTVTPTTAALTLTAFTPTVNFTAHQTITIPVATLTLTTFAPSISVTAASTIVVPNASLTLTTFAPTVSAIADTNIVPATASLVTARFAPTVTASNHQLVTPTTKALTLTTFAPVMRLSVTPSTAVLNLGTYAATVSVSDNALVVPLPTALVLAGLAPTVSTPRLVTPGVTALALTTFAPDIGLSEAPDLVPITAHLFLTTFAPVIRNEFGGISGGIGSSGGLGGTVLPGGGIHEDELVPVPEVVSSITSTGGVKGSIG